LVQSAMEFPQEKNNGNQGRGGNERIHDPADNRFQASILTVCIHGQGQFLGIFFRHLLPCAPFGQGILVKNGKKQLIPGDTRVMGRSKRGFPKGVFSSELQRKLRKRRGVFRWPTAFLATQENRFPMLWPSHGSSGRRSSAGNPGNSYPGDPSR
jgi:hypothetical protein